MATIEDVHAICRDLPGVEERETTGGRAWFVRRALFAWECHPWPSIPADVREILAHEQVLGVKLEQPRDAWALRQMDPSVFLPQTTRWGEPKIALRMAVVDVEHLRELVVEAWRLQAPAYLRRAFDDAEVTTRAASEQGGLVGGTPVDWSVDVSAKEERT